MTQLTIALLVALLPFSASNLAGTWTGSIADRQDNAASDGSAYLQLQQQEGRITGSVGPSSDKAHPIEKVSFSGDELRFSTHYTDPESNETVTWLFDLKVNGNSMEGTGTGSRGDHSWTVDIRLSRREMAGQKVQ